MIWILQRFGQRTPEDALMRHNSPLAQRVIFLSLACCAAAWGQLPSPTVTELDRSEANCRKIAQLTVHDYSIVSAVFVDATDQAPAYCRVLGVLPPEIVFQVVLPAAWNGRILMNGNGGYAGNRLDGPVRGGIEQRTAEGSYRSAPTQATTAMPSRWRRSLSTTGRKRSTTAFGPCASRFRPPRN